MSSVRAVVIAALCSVLSAGALAGCATVDCAEQARATAPSDAKLAAAEQARCERRLARMRGTLDDDEGERQAAERRDAFRGRAEARSGGQR